MNTRKIIIDSAFSLLEEKSFEDLVVQDILNRAHISRKTFYKFFPDKYALMHLYYENYINEKVINEFDGHNWRKLQSVCFEFINERRSYFQNINKIEGQNSFWEFLHDYSFKFYKEIILHNTKKDSLSEIEYYTLQSIVNGGVAVFKEYATVKKSDLTPQQFSDLLCNLIPKEYQEYID